MRLAWATDVHLNFLEPPAIGRFLDALTADAPDGVVLTGDISEAPDIEDHLAMIEAHFDVPVWFVLGNHDYYRARIANVRREMERWSAAHPRVRWLPSAGVVPLTASTALVGVDGWGDARLGNADHSPVRLSDFHAIGDLAPLEMNALLRKLRALGDEEGRAAREVLHDALERYENVVFATHIPPFREACWHEGAISDDDWLPYFTCKAVGDAITELAAARPDRRVTVLCGHTHSGGVARPLPNVEVHTGAARYGDPHPQTPLDVA